MSFYEFQTVIGYKFENLNLLKQALTHPSIKHRDSFGRLYLAGESILFSIITDYVTDTIQPMAVEELVERRTRLTTPERLTQRARDVLKIQNYIIKPHHVELDMDEIGHYLEAVIAAIERDGGREASKMFVLKYIVKDRRSSSFNCTT